MKNTTLTLSILTLVTAGIIGVTTVLPAEAYLGDPNTKGPNYSAERHEAMERSFENKDYNAWKELMQNRGRVMSLINEQNFARFAEAHELAEQGKFAEADAIRKELGLRTRAELGKRGGFGRGDHCNR